MTITIKCGASKITLTPTALVMEGMPIKLN
jgi:hypothetical protein